MRILFCLFLLSTFIVKGQVEFELCDEIYQNPYNLSHITIGLEQDTLIFANLSSDRKIISLDSSFNFEKEQVVLVVFENKKYKYVINFSSNIFVNCKQVKICFTGKKTKSKLQYNVYYCGFYGMSGYTDKIKK